MEQIANATLAVEKTKQERADSLRSAGWSNPWEMLSGAVETTGTALKRVDVLGVGAAAGAVVGAGAAVGTAAGNVVQGVNTMLVGGVQASSRAVTDVSTAVAKPIVGAGKTLVVKPVTMAGKAVTTGVTTTGRVIGAGISTTGRAIGTAVSSTGRAMASIVNPGPSASATSASEPLPGSSRGQVKGRSSIGTPKGTGSQRR